MLIVQLCDLGADGDFEHRVHAPARAMASLPGVSVIDCHPDHPRRKQLCRQADVVVAQFFPDWSLLDLCERRRRVGKITVFEANDYFPDLQPWNPIAKRWNEPSVAAVYARLLRAADGVQTSTDRLAVHWGRAGARDVAVFPNHLSEVHELPALPTRPLTIGWAGSPGHFADWLAVARLVQEWALARPHVRLAVMAHPLADDFVELPAERYSCRPFGTLAEYFDFLGRIDIGLAPLLPTEYNRCRSDVKFLEYASKGVVGIFCDLDPYRTAVAQSGAGLLYREPAQIVDALERLAADASLRHEMRRRGHDYVRRNRLLADQIGRRVQWYERLLGRRWHKSAPAGVGPGPGPRYRQLAAAGSGDTDCDPCSRARILIAQNDHRTAVTVLAESLVADGDDPEIRTELGRALYLADDTPAAERELLATIAAFPTYLPAYEYLLRLHQITASPNAALFAEQAIREFPDTYTLVLNATAALPPTRAAEHITGQLRAMAASATNAGRAQALTAFRAAIMRTLAEGPSTNSGLALMRQACQVFPESALLAGIGGRLLLDSGFAEEGFNLLARAASLRQAGETVAAEFAAGEAIDWRWVLAQHIVSHTAGGSESRQAPTGGAPLRSPATMRPRETR